MSFTAPQVAFGQYGGYGWPYDPYYGGYGYLNTNTNRSVPYFSVFPPVYYSYPVARTFGYSPYAYPPGVVTPGSESPAPAVVQNTYAPAENNGETQQTRPLRIDNPFVEQADKPGVTKNQAPRGRVPQVVHPAVAVQRPLGVRPF
jgi:hypothetical protein